MEKKTKVESKQIAGREYEVEDYNRQDELSSGLATTHEQVSDDYMEGTIDTAAGFQNGSKSENEQ